MSILEICGWLDNSPLAVAIREWNGLFATIETFHVIALVQVAGSIFLIDLRLMGLASRKYPVAQMLREILPYTWVGFAVAAVSGSLMFVSHATQYYGNFSFRMKMLLLLTAGVNMLTFHLLTYRGVANWTLHPPRAAKIAGAVSVVLWIAIVTFGRWIGYTMLPF